jgi:hypothetical protein
VSAAGWLADVRAHSQKWMLEWLKMSASALRLWKHWGDSTMPTSSPPSIIGIIFMKKVGSAICKGWGLQRCAIRNQKVQGNTLRA